MNTSNDNNQLQMQSSANDMVHHHQQQQYQQQSFQQSQSLPILPSLPTQQQSNHIIPQQQQSINSNPNILPQQQQQSINPNPNILPQNNNTNNNQQQQPQLLPSQNQMSIPQQNIHPQQSVSPPQNQMSAQTQILPNNLHAQQQPISQTQNLPNHPNHNIPSIHETLNYLKMQSNFPMQQLPQYSVNNAINGNNLNQTAEKFINKDINVEILKDKCTESYLELKADFDECCSMKLGQSIHDRTVLDGIFAMIKHFKNEKFLFTFFYAAYEHKYSHLIEKYDCLNLYLTFAIQLAIHNNLNSIRQMVSGGFNSYSNNSNFVKLIFGRNDLINKQKRKSNEIEEKHPIFSTSFYNKYKVLFEIGKICNVIIPGNFCTLFINFNNQLLRKLGKSQMVTELKGLQISFTNPIHSILNHTESKTYSYYHAINMNHLTQILSTVFEMSNYKNPITVSKNKVCTLLNLDTNALATYKDGELKYDVQYTYSSIINNVSIYFTETGYTGKTYSNIYFGILKEMHLNEIDFDTYFKEFDNLLAKAQPQLDVFYNAIKSNENDNNNNNAKIVKNEVVDENNNKITVDENNNIIVDENNNIIVDENNNIIGSAANNEVAAVAVAVNAADETED